MGYIGYNTGVYIGIIENKMETTIMGYIGYILGLYRDTEKEKETTKVYHRVFRGI